MNEQDKRLEELVTRLRTLEFQVVKLDRLVYKLFKRLKEAEYPQPN